jgi:hypothetical protein
MRKVSFAVFFLSLAGVASADPVTIVNPSFESPGGTFSLSVTGWNQIITGGGSEGTYNPYEFYGPNAYYVGANPGTDPANSGPGYPGINGEELAWTFITDAGSGFSQTLSATLQAGASYTLTVSEGQRNGFDVTGTNNGSVPPSLGSLIELLAGSTVIASALDELGPGPGRFADQVAFLPTSNAYAGLIGQQLSIRLLTVNNPTANNQGTDWDNVRLDATTSATPEPATLAMAIFGIVGLVTLRRRW